MLDVTMGMVGSIREEENKPGIIGSLTNILNFMPDPNIEKER